MATGETTATVGGMISAGIGILERQLPLIGVFALIVLVQQAVKFLSLSLAGASATGFIDFIVAIAAFFVTVMLTRELMVREGLATAGIPLRFGTYLGVSIVIGLAVVVGSVLLIVPGIMIMLRWYLAPYFVLARGAGFDEALSASRDATNGHRWAIFGVFLLLGLAYLFLFGGVMAAAGGFAAYSQIANFGPITIVAIVVQAVLSAVSVAMLLGTFAALADRDNQFEHVFN